MGAAVGALPYFSMESEMNSSLYDKLALNSFMPPVHYYGCARHNPKMLEVQLAIFMAVKKKGGIHGGGGDKSSVTKWPKLDTQGNFCGWGPERTPITVRSPKKGALAKKRWAKANR
jgi:hypothetical protein